MVEDRGKENIGELYHRHFGQWPDQVELLPASGSARKYYRIGADGNYFMGTWNPDVKENELFLDFSRHFKELGLHVPRIYVVAADKMSYIQEDLGNRMLLDIVVDEREGNRLSPRSIALYKKALSELLRFQIQGNKGFDYTRCVPRPVFDRRCILWDLNYFKYCFLKLACAFFSEEALEDDFELLADRLCCVDTRSFMFRDFQSRNIMVRDEEVWFIDYQGGRQGALHYDVASLLYDAIVNIPEDQREELLDYYIGELQQYRTVLPEDFRQDYYQFVLIRLLQAMGAFGLRGLYEHKQHFLDSIQPGLQNITSLFESGKLGEEYPEIRRVVVHLFYRH